jgi:hypothetical protein
MTKQLRRQVVGRFLDGESVDQLVGWLIELGEINPRKHTPNERCLIVEGAIRAGFFEAPTPNDWAA